MDLLPEILCALSFIIMWFTIILQRKQIIEHETRIHQMIFILEKLINLIEEKETKCQKNQK